MISLSDLWTVSYTVGAIALLATVGGFLVVRLLAARPR
jgi:hypothetical protein